MSCLLTTTEQFDGWYIGPRWAVCYTFGTARRALGRMLGAVPNEMVGVSTTYYVE